MPRPYGAPFVSDREIEALTRAMIALHGSNAARAASKRVNDMIDCNDPYARDVWARVVRSINALQRCDPFSIYLGTMVDR